MALSLKRYHLSPPSSRYQIFAELRQLLLRPPAAQCSPPDFSSRPFMRRLLTGRSLGESVDYSVVHGRAGLLSSSSLAHTHTPSPALHDTRNAHARPLGRGRAGGL